MNPIVEILDDFFFDIEGIRSCILGGEFEDIVSPVDGVIYPAINSAIDDNIKLLVEKQLSGVMGRSITTKTLFSRAMFEGMPAPNKIHSDVIMGRYAMHVYLSRHWPEGAGTTFWTSREQGPRHHHGIDVSRIRPNHHQDWERYASVQAAFNRCLVHRGDSWHLAEPIGGWGTEPENARLVLTAFFD